MTSVFARLNPFTVLRRFFDPVVLVIPANQGFLLHNPGGQVVLRSFRDVFSGMRFARRLGLVDVGLCDVSVYSAVDIDGTTLGLDQALRRDTPAGERLRQELFSEVPDLDRIYRCELVYLRKATRQERLAMGSVATPGAASRDTQQLLDVSY